MLLIAASAAAQSHLELIRAGDAAYLQRAEGKKPVRLAIAKWEQACALDPKDTVCLTRIAQGYSYLGRFHADADAAARLYTNGHNYAKRAVENDGKSGPAHYWFAYTLAKSVEQKNKFAKLSVIGDVTVHLHTARSLKPDVDYGGPDRMLGQLALDNHVPSMKLARDFAQASLSYGPNYSENLLLMARTQLKADKANEAEKLLKKLLSLEPMPGCEKELDADKNTARDLLKRINP